MDEKKMKALEILVCPESKNSLKYNKNTNELICEESGLIYPIEDGVINFLSGSDKSPKSIDAYEQSGTIKFLRKVFNILRVSSTFKTKKNKNRI